MTGQTRERHDDDSKFQCRAAGSSGPAPSEVDQTAPAWLRYAAWSSLLMSVVAVAAYTWATSDDIRLRALEDQSLQDPSVREMAASLYFSLLLNVGNVLLLALVASLAARFAARRVKRLQARNLIRPAAQIVMQIAILVFVFVRFVSG